MNNGRWELEPGGWRVYEQALACLDQADWTRALALLAGAETTFRGGNDHAGLWRVLIGQALLHWRAGALGPAVERAMAALRAAEAAGNRFAAGCVAWQLASMALDQGDYATAAEYLDQAQMALDMAGMAPPGGALAAAARLCTEIIRWRQAGERGQLDPREAEAAMVRVRAELLARLTQAAVALRTTQAAEETVLLIPSPGLPDSAALRPTVGARLTRWWRRLISDEPPSDEGPAPAPSPTLLPAPAPESGGSSDTLPAPAAPETAPPQALEQRRPAAEPRAGLAVHCFGSFRVYLDDTPIEHWASARSRAILKYLVARRGTAIPKEVLADLFWADSEPELARRSLHQAIYCLRQTFKRIAPDTPIIQFAGDRYQINPEIAIWVDSEAFSRAIEQARAHDTAGETEQALRAYAVAVDLYGGEFLEEDRYEEWAAEPRRAYQARYLEALHRLAAHHHERGDHPAAIILCQRALTHESCDEEAHRMLMACYMAQNLRHLAVRQYQICAATLKTELGLAPSEELEAFYRRVLATG